MKKSFLIAYLSFLVSVSAHAYNFDAGVPAAATMKGKEPLFSVDGRINYQVFSGTTGHRINNCVLIHGYGISQKTLNMLNKIDGLKDKLEDLKGNLPAARMVTDALDRGMIIPPIARQYAAPFVPAETLDAVDGLGQQLGRLEKLSPAHAFGFFYFGKYLIAGLLDRACDNVYVPVQESNQSSTLEMIVRTERFVRELCEPRKGQGSCALVGHDKGAVVVTSILRRCAEAVPATPGAPLVVGGSEMGPAACSQIVEAYSAAGAIEGGLLPVIIAGSRGLKERQENLKKVQSWTLGFVDFNKEFDQGIRKIHRIEDTGEKFSIDFTSDKTPDTNPFWYDQSPIAEIDGDGKDLNRTMGVPIETRHGPDFKLTRSGWLGNIEYAASSTAFRFDKTNYTEEVVGDLHLPRLDKNDPEQITLFLPPIPDRPRLLPNGGINLRNQRPDKIAKRQAAKEKLDLFFEPFIHGQHFANGLLENMVAEAHGDNHVQQTLGWGLENIAGDYAERITPRNLDEDEKERKEREKQIAKIKNAYLKKLTKRFRLAPGEEPEEGIIYFQESDGLTETGSALGVCNRSRIVEANLNIVASCATFPKTNHLGLTGMSTDAADHIVKQLSASQIQR